MAKPQEVDMTTIPLHRIRAKSKMKGGKKVRVYDVVVHHRHEIDGFFAKLEDYLDITEERISAIVVTVVVKD